DVLLRMPAERARCGDSIITGRRLGRCQAISANGMVHACVRGKSYRIAIPDEALRFLMGGTPAGVLLEDVHGVGVHEMRKQLDVTVWRTTGDEGVAGLQVVDGNSGPSIVSAAVGHEAARVQVVAELPTPRHVTRTIAAIIVPRCRRAIAGATADGVM